LVLVFNRILQKTIFAKKSPEDSRGFFLSAIINFFIISVFSLLFNWGCAPKIHPPAAEKETISEPVIKVCIDEEIDSKQVNFVGEFILRLEEAIYRVDQTLGEFVVEVKNDKLVIKSEKRFFELSKPADFIFQPVNPSSKFIWENTQYSGALEILYSDKNSCAVNKLSIETYLSGVVPFEIPTGLEEYREAVFAQTVAARSYALYRMSNPAKESFDVYADVRDQVYNGLKKKTTLSEQAIRESRGQVLLNQGVPVFSQYHSTCGGILANIEHNKIEIYPDSIHKDLTQYEYNCTLSPYYRWMEIRDAETIFQNLKDEYNLDMATANRLLETGFKFNIKIVDRSLFGRVEKLEIQLPDKTLDVPGYRIRRLLASSDGTPLRSNLFFLLKTDGSADKIYIIGAGYGHGKGMCQWGAIGMALKNVSYQDILNFYYPGYQLQTIY
jgi:stage II sporulation protein D